MGIKTEDQLAQLAQMACALEACAPKPGNVNRCNDFADTPLEDFLVSAIAVGPAFEHAGRAGVGEIVLDAVKKTRRCVKTNTNLGMILLLAPLVKACCRVTDAKDIRSNLSRILSSLTMEDARLAFAAIRHSHPGGMGKVLQSDVADEPSITLLQAMGLAQDRDAIAREYVSDYAITFETGLPAMKNALAQSGKFSDAIVQTYLTILHSVPDTLIARKKGAEAARMASQLAASVLAKGGMYTREGRAAAAEMDRALRDDKHTLNPGTTADLTTAVIFLTLI